jgi:hypothetical protein
MMLRRRRVVFLREAMDDHRLRAHRRAVPLIGASRAADLDDAESLERAPGSPRRGRAPHPEAGLDRPVFAVAGANQRG